MCDIFSLGYTALMIRRNIANILICFRRVWAVYKHGILLSGSDRKFGSVRFGSVVRCFFRGSVRFGSVENFGRTTEFFVQKMARN